MSTAQSELQKLIAQVNTYANQIELADSKLFTEQLELVKQESKLESFCNQKQQFLSSNQTSMFGSSSNNKNDVQEEPVSTSSNQFAAR